MKHVPVLTANHVTPMPPTSVKQVDRAGKGSKNTPPRPKCTTEITNLLSCSMPQKQATVSERKIWLSWTLTIIGEQGGWERVHSSEPSILPSIGDQIGPIDTPYRPHMIPFLRRQSKLLILLFLINRRRRNSSPVTVAKAAKDGLSRMSLRRRMSKQQPTIIRPTTIQPISSQVTIWWQDGWLALRQETGTPLIESLSISLFLFANPSSSSSSPSLSLLLCVFFYSHSQSFLAWRRSMFRSKIRVFVLQSRFSKLYDNLHSIHH